MQIAGSSKILQIGSSLGHFYSVFKCNVLSVSFHFLFPKISLGTFVLREGRETSAFLSLALGNLLLHQAIPLIVASGNRCAGNVQVFGSGAGCAGAGARLCTGNR